MRFKKRFWFFVFFLFRVRGFQTKLIQDTFIAQDITTKISTISIKVYPTVLL